MKHFVFLVTGYYPLYSGNGRCMKNIIDYFEDDTKITVICQNVTGDLPKTEYVNRTNIIRVNTNRLLKKSKYKAKALRSNNSFKRKMYQITYKWLRLKDALLTIVSRTSLKKDLIQSYYNALVEINEPIDVLFPCCYPMESCVAAQMFSEKKIPVIPFFIDKFADSMNLHKISFNKALKLKRHRNIEEDIIQNSKILFYHNSWKNYLSKNNMLNTDKLYEFQLPLIKQIENTSVETLRNNDSINFAYTGLLDHKVRPAEYFIEVVESYCFAKEEKKFHIMSTGTYDNQLNELQSKYPENIEFYGRRSNSEANNLIMNCDVLISVGNRDVSQFASKTLEYVSTGKIIIHFFENKDDPVIEFLEKYPLALIIDQHNIRPYEANDLINDFISKNLHRNVSFNIVEEIYQDATPKYVVEKIIKVLSKEGYYEKSNN